MTGTPLAAGCREVRPTCSLVRAGSCVPTAASRQVFPIPAKHTFRIGELTPVARAGPSFKLKMCDAVGRATYADPLIGFGASAFALEPLRLYGCDSAAISVPSVLPTL
jgi:hypothetical protein